jgi:glycosyltransferase involved in cell wall biosynthesis
MSPLFSIITVVYNGENLIAGTMQSVLNQSFVDYEYLIIDGQSKDKTLQVVESIKNQFYSETSLKTQNSELKPKNTEGGMLNTEHRLTNTEYRSSEHGTMRIFSERDKGLYDAMNKGLRLAKGEFVLFLNCGDRLFTSHTLEKIAAARQPNTDILFGETMLVNDAREHIGTRTALTVQKLPQRLTWQDMRFGMVVCHQSFLPSRKLTPQYIEGNLAADIDWVIQCLKKAENPTHTGIIISEYLMGGVSKARHQQSLRDRYAVLEKHFGKVGNFLNHVVITLRAVWFKVKNWGKPSY